MYKIASENAQRGVSRIPMADLMLERDKFTVSDRYDALVRALKNLETRIMSLAKDSDERADLGQQKNRIQCELKELKPLLGRETRLREGLSHYFVDEAKRALTPMQFKRILAAARIAHDAETGVAP